MPAPEHPLTLEQFSERLFSSKYRLPVWWAVGQYATEPLEPFDAHLISSDIKEARGTDISRSNVQRQIDALVGLEWAAEMPPNEAMRKRYRRLESKSWPGLLAVIEEVDTRTREAQLQFEIIHGMDITASFDERLAALDKLGLSRRAIGSAMGVSDYRARRLTQGADCEPDEWSRIDVLRQAMASLIFKGGFDNKRAVKIMTTESDSPHFTELENRKPVAVIPVKPEATLAYVDQLVTVPYAPLPPPPTGRQAGQRRPMR